MGSGIGGISKEMQQTLKMVSPGSELREGIDNILNAKTGALIVIGDDADTDRLCDGGFLLNIPFTPNHVYELAKMDGALVLSSDGKRIRYANVHINPDAAIETVETGTRHKCAERMAKQTGNLVITVSQRRNIITLFQGSEKYVLRDLNLLHTKANQGIQTLQRYRRAYDEGLRNLTALEMDESATLSDACSAIRRAHMVLGMAADIEDYVVELGTEARLVRMQIDELTTLVPHELRNLVKDYMRKYSEEEAKAITKKLTVMKSEELMDVSNIAVTLGYANDIEMLDAPVFSRGYRILSKIPRLPGNVINNIISHFDDFQEIVESTGEELNEVEGVGIVRARNILEGFRRIRERTTNAL